MDGNNFTVLGFMRLVLPSPGLLFGPVLSGDEISDLLERLEAKTDARRRMTESEGQDVG
jgi:hypothetical protein